MSDDPITMPKEEWDALFAERVIPELYADCPFGFYTPTEMQKLILEQSPDSYGANYPHVRTIVNSDEDTDEDESDTTSPPVTVLQAEDGSEARLSDTDVTSTRAGHITRLSGRTDTDQFRVGTTYEMVVGTDAHSLTLKRMVYTDERGPYRLVFKS